MSKFDEDKSPLLPFEDEFARAAALVMLKSIFLKPKKDYRVEQLIIVRRLVKFEYQSALQPSDFFRKPSLASILFEYILHHFDSETASYVTQDITREVDLKRIIRQYSPEVLKDTVSREEEKKMIAKSGMELPKSEPLFVPTYFRSKRFMDCYGPLEKSVAEFEFKTDYAESDRNFENRIKDLFRVPPILEKIFLEVLSPQKIPDKAENKTLGKPSILGITQKQYQDFNIASILGDILNLIQNTLKIQTYFLHQYLLGRYYGEQESTTQSAVIIKGLVKILNKITCCSLEEEKPFKELIQWELWRLRIAYEVENFTGSSERPFENDSIREQFIISLEPTFAKTVSVQAESVPKVINDLLSAESKKIIGKILSTRAVHCYWITQLCGLSQDFYKNQRWHIANKIKRYKNSEEPGVKSHWENAQKALKMEIFQQYSENSGGSTPPVASRYGGSFLVQRTVSGQQNGSSLENSLP